MERRIAPGDGWRDSVYQSAEIERSTIRSETMKRRPRLVALLALLALARFAPAMTPEQRRAYLEKFNQTLPAVPSFTTWLQRTGELPPDFDALPKINGLPD